MTCPKCGKAMQITNWDETPDTVVYHWKCTCGATKDSVEEK